MEKAEYFYDEAKLMKMIAYDREDAFQILFERHRSRTYKQALRYLKSTVVAEEVVQEVFMKLWTNRATLHARGPIEAWLFTVTKNNILNRIKKIANEEKALEELRVTHEIEDDSTQEILLDKDYQYILKEALRLLTEKQLEIYTLARQSNLSYFQIAQHLNISPLTVKTHMSRALCQIRSFLSTQRICSQ